MITKIITGGQSGSDQAAWWAAKQCGVPTSGWMPKHFKTEEGCMASFASTYNAKEHKSSDYKVRTQANVKDADVVLLFGNPYSPGGICTAKAAESMHKPIMLIENESVKVPEVVEWLRVYLKGTSGVVMCAGNRESVAPAIGEWVERYMILVLRAMATE